MESTAEKTLSASKRELLLLRLKRTAVAHATSLPPIPLADRSEPLPLSFAQQRLWFVDLLDHAAGAAYHMPAALRLQGSLNKSALRATLDRIVVRHESLRTTFIDVDGVPIQVVAAPDCGFLLTEQDLTLLEGSEQEFAVSRISNEEVSRAFDLTKGPLIRGQLISLGHDDHILLITQHHIISDWWSIGVLIREVSALYSAFSAGQSDPLPPLSLQYADYAAWQRSWLQGDVLAAQTSFWKDYLAGAPDLITLPTDRPRPTMQSYAGGTVELTLSKECAAGLKMLSQRHGVTLFMTMLAGWAMLLSRLSGQQDIVVGTPIANRQRSEVESLIGFFVNTLALRVTLHDDPSIAELIAHIKANTLRAFEHQDLPFEQVVEALQPARSMSHSPLFQVMLNMTSASGTKSLNLSGLELSSIDQEQSASQFDLSLSLNDTGNEIYGSLQYASDLFDAVTIERLANYFPAILNAMVENDQQRVSDIELLTDAERYRLLVEFNNTKTKYPDGQLLHQLFEAQAATHPDAIALVFEEQRFSYSELNRRANQLAHYLIDQGVKPDDRVAICIERGPEMIIAMLGVLKAGGGYVPLDPSYPADRLGFMLSDSAPAVVLTQSALINGLLPLDVPVLLLDDGAAITMLGGQACNNPTAAVVGLLGRHLAYVIYTSGSTGMPKGVMVEHANVVNFVHGHIDACELTTRDRVLQFASFSFDASVGEIFSTLSAGAMLVVRPADIVGPDVAFNDLLEQHQITVSDLPTAFWHQWAQEIQLKRSRHCPSLRLVIAGGEKAECRHLVSWFAEPGCANRRWLNTYGPTETTVTVTAIAYDDQSSLLIPSVPIGRPNTNTAIYILDAHRQPVPLGTAGEIYVSGAGVARGYLNRPELTAERFISDPFSDEPNARMYKTGDLGRWLPDGSIEYLGRNDFQVKVRGFRIELGEIENKLIACSGVRDAIVIAREDMPGDKRLVAYLLAHELVELSAAELRSQLAASLADYMIPSAFMTLAAYPLTSTGKIDRKSLPMPDMASVNVREYVVPVGEIEETVARIWQALLGVERVGRHDHFFDLGGHSLMAVQLMSQVRKELGVELNLRELFSNPMLAAFSEAVGRARKTSLTAIVAVDRNHILPLSFAQQRIWFVDKLDPAAGSAYLMPAALRIKGPLQTAALQATLDRIVARHESLRTTFVEVDGTPTQVISAPDCGFALKHRDLSQLSAEKQESAAAQIAAEEVSEPLNLATGPLIRGQLLRLSKEEHILLLTQHHIITDGWSVNILVQEVSELYQAFSTGKPDPLPPLTIQYADYAAWQRNWLTVDVLQAQTQFWKSYLADAPGLLTLPTDRPRPAVRNYVGASVPMTLSPELASRLRALSLRHGTTLFMTLLAGWSVFLARISGQPDVVIGTPIANRQRSEIESIIGFFVNTLALRVNIVDDPSVAELLARVKADTLSAYEHQDLPFEQVVEVVQPVRSMSYSPLFQVILNWESAQESKHSSASELSVSPIEQSYSMTQFDLTLFLKDVGGEIVGSWRYTVDLFDAATIERLSANFNSMLMAMVSDDELRVSQLNLLHEAEQQRVLIDFNRTQTNERQDQLIHNLFEEQVRERPDAVAVIYEDERLSYGELNRRANKVAHYLIAQGVRPDTVVGICVDRSVEMLVAIMGTLKAGGGYLPIDPALPTDRIAHMLRDSASKVVLTQSALLGHLPSLDVPTLALDSVDNVELARQLEHNPDSVALGLQAHHLAYVIYTSGSTGISKGVMIEHRSPINFLRAMERTTYRHCQRHSTVALNATYSFDMSLKGILQLLSGRCLVLIPQWIRADGAALLAFLERHRVEAFDCTPSQLAVLLSAGLLESESYQPTSVLIGGEAIDAVMWQRLKNARRIRFYNMYGPTECTVDATIGCINELGDIPTIGQPIDNMQVYILDDKKQPVPIGVAGELYIGGVGVARGYLNRPELTAERFVKVSIPRLGCIRLYRTGDVGRWLSNGTIEYLGRNDFQVKIRGFRIELGEIESKLSACPGVRGAIVITREDQPGDKRLVAYLLAHDGIELSAAALRGQLSNGLPEYMIPSAFVTLDAFPLTNNGKLNRNALPVPDGAAVAVSEFAAPVGKTEEVVALIWQELLELEQVGRRDNFFDLGGHSLLGILLLSRIRQELNVEIPLRELFVHPTLQEFASAINAQTQFAAFSNLVPIRPTGSLTPLFLVHPSEGEVGYARDLAPWLNAELPIYGLAATGLLTGEIPLTTIEEIAARYLREIRQVQPHGPYRLAGWSAGGTIAYEIAHQLIGSDERVEFLGLFDTSSDYKSLRHRLYGEQKIPERSVGFEEWMRSLAWLSTDTPTDERDKLRALADSEDIEALLAYGQATGEMPREIDKDILRRHLALRHATGHALIRYVRPSIPVAISLFSAVDENREERRFDWHDTPNLQVIPVRGTHFTMMEFPHIKELGAAIDKELSLAGNRIVLAEELNYSPTITIQSGRATQPPLFCVPGAGASVTAFAALAQALDPTIPIYGLQPRGLCGELVPHVDVPSAVRSYIHAIRDISPTGPYRLLGHSFGGWVATEIARQLVAAGEKVERLIVLDSSAPASSVHREKRYTRSEMLMKLVEIYQLTLNRSLSLTGADFVGLEPEAQLALLLSRLIEAKMMPRGTSLRTLRGIVQVFSANLNTNYVPEGRYSGPLHLVVVPDTSQHEKESSVDVSEIIAGWRQYAPETKCWTGPGNHMTLLAMPHVEELAGWLRPLLSTQQ